jgi:hypothetical protein
MDKYTEARDLRLADLGYYKIDYLKQIDLKETFLISKLKSTTVVYKKSKSSKGEILKSTEYIKIDIFDLIKPLADGQTIELKDTYIGSKIILSSTIVFSARDIIYEEDSTEISELKSFYQVTEFLTLYGLKFLKVN